MTFARRKSDEAESRQRRFKPAPAPHLVPRMPAQEIDDAKLEQRDRQMAMDPVDEASMESFPCSDPPSYTVSHI